MTVAVLPAVWLVNRGADDAAAPNVAVVGVPADVASAPAPVAAGTVDPMGQVAPAYLTDRMAGRPDGARQPVVVGPGEQAEIGVVTATYRRDVGRPGACLYNGVAMGELITVVNVDNGRSVECWTAPRLDDGAPPDEVVLSPASFAEIADPTDAPIHVEIRL